LQEDDEEDEDVGTYRDAYFVKLLAAQHMLNLNAFISIYIYSIYLLSKFARFIKGLLFYL
jgi:hypothetical protein